MRINSNSRVKCMESKAGSASYFINICALVSELRYVGIEIDNCELVEELF